MWKFGFWVLDLGFRVSGLRWRVQLCGKFGMNRLRVWRRLSALAVPGFRAEGFRQGSRV